MPCGKENAEAKTLVHLEELDAYADHRLGSSDARAPRQAAEGWCPNSEAFVLNLLIGWASHRLHKKAGMSVRSWPRFPSTIRNTGESVPKKPARSLMKSPILTQNAGCFALPTTMRNWRSVPRNGYGTNSNSSRYNSTTRRNSWRLRVLNRAVSPALEAPRRPAEVSLGWTELPTGRAGLVTRLYRCGRATSVTSSAMASRVAIAATARGRGPRGCSIPWRLASRRCRDQTL